ncbi:MAG: homocysteine S-methyltransferase family protein [Paracoccaceae bacterium]|nr:homocysteine S-methyltransferase family protein [Paracoccaceae bacterium]MDE2912240.1 homocysteine S-methyltransferase family protein [Paracoccaceae bacterium]
MDSVTILDGGMGQELLARTGAIPKPLWSAQVMIDHPDVVRAVHDDYFAAGAEIATTNSYSVLHDRLVPEGLDHMFADLHRLACRMAAEARDAHGHGRVAGSLGPLGWSYCPDLSPHWEQAAETYAEIVRLQVPAVDLLLIETMASVDQARGALAGTSVANKPVWLAVTVDCRDGRRLRSGEEVTNIIPLAHEFAVDAILVNCSTPEATTRAIQEIAPRRDGLALGAYANGFAGIPEAFMTAGATADILEVRNDLDAGTYADFADCWVDGGATIVGGCCEIGPTHIREIARRFGKRP